MDAAFEQIKGSAPGGIDTYGDLALAIAAATENGDRGLAIRLTRLKGRADAIADRAKTRLRRNNPALDRALVENGRVSKPLR